MPFILGANSLTGGYTVDNSLRFDDGSSDYLDKTYGSAGNRQIWTYSFWVKKTTNASTLTPLDASSDGNNRSLILFDSDNIRMVSLVSGSVTTNLITSAVYRDVSAWYHIIVAFDSTQATASNRVKFYVNGTQVTSFGTATYPSLNQNEIINNNVKHSIGRDGFYTNQYLDGYMSEINFIDGQALTPTDFGEFDEDSGIWKPIAYAGTYGTNGFYLETKDSGALGADTSGNANNFTVNNLTAVDQSTDTPTNNFCTLNPLASGVAIGGVAGTFTDGNLFFSGASAAWCATKGTFSVTQGKWYFEAKKTTNANGTTVGASAVGIGYAELQNNLGNVNPVNDASVYGNILMLHDNGWTTNFATGTQWSPALAVDNGNIVGIALDLDGNTYTFYVNGVSKNSGSLGGGYDSLGLTPCVYNYGGDTREFTCNFGSAPYAIASGNADANGFGNFEYSVPTGYYSLCTKNIAEFG